MIERPLVERQFAIYDNFTIHEHIAPCNSGQNLLKFRSESAKIPVRLWWIAGHNPENSSQTLVNSGQICWITGQRMVAYRYFSGFWPVIQQSSTKRQVSVLLPTGKGLRAPVWRGNPVRYLGVFSYSQVNSSYCSTGSGLLKLVFYASWNRHIRTFGNLTICMARNGKQKDCALARAFDQNSHSEHENCNICTLNNNF